MNRFFLDPEQFTNDRVVFPADLAHQILHVLRLGEGDEVSVLDDRGQIYRVALSIDPGQSRVTGKIMDHENVDTEPAVCVSLCFGLSNRDKVEWILQKGTEIGISAFYPFVSSRTLVRSKDLSKKRIDRWERIIREAAEQSGRGRLPRLVLPMHFKTCLTETDAAHDLCLIAWEEAEQSRTSIKSLMKKFDGKTIALFVGPEGGFSKNEVDEADQLGVQRVSLGKRILRMETAAIVFPALVLHELGAI